MTNTKSDTFLKPRFDLLNLHLNLVSILIFIKPLDIFKRVYVKKKKLKNKQLRPYLCIIHIILLWS